MADILFLITGLLCMMLTLDDTGRTIGGTITYLAGLACLLSGLLGLAFGSL